MGEKTNTYNKNPHLDFLFGFFGGAPAPTKKDEFKPVEFIETDADGNEKIIKDFYQRKPSKENVKKFQGLIRERASIHFNSENIIVKPNNVEVVLSVSITPKRFKIVDVDNLAKTILDGLTGIAFEDDSQVSSLVVKKHIHPMKINGLFIGITELTDKRKGLTENIKLFSGGN